MRGHLSAVLVLGLAAQLAHAATAEEVQAANLEELAEVATELVEAAAAGAEPSDQREDHCTERETFSPTNFTGLKSGRLPPEAQLAELQALERKQLKEDHERKRLKAGVEPDAAHELEVTRALAKLERRQELARRRLARRLATTPNRDREWERKCFGGVWSGLNVRGRAVQFEIETGIAFGRRGVPVAFKRHAGRFLVLPVFAGASASELWGFFAGVRVSQYLLKGEFSLQLRSGNVEFPSFGFLAHSQFDRFRFEVDVAPVIGLYALPPPSGEAAMLAALASDPRDDILFLPNLKGGGRVRGWLRARFDPFDCFSLALDVSATLGYVETRTPHGNPLDPNDPLNALTTDSSGTVGGAEAALELMFPTRWAVVEGISVRLAFGLGFSSAWPTDVAFPLRSSVAVGVSLGRNTELVLIASGFTRSVALSRFVEFGSLGLGARFSFGAEPTVVRSAADGMRDSSVSKKPSLL